MIDESQMTLLRTWDGDRHCIDGWFVSEKLNGCRAYWDGFEFWTRGGNKINVPKDWKREMPRGIHIDGEIWAGRYGFEIARVSVQYGKFVPGVEFVGFDAPKASGTWDKRMKVVRDCLRGENVRAIDFGIVRSERHAAKLVEKIWYADGEGIVLRNPEIDFYEIGRTENCLRVKM